MNPPAGAWPSPITARDVYAGRVERSAPTTDGDDEYWTESRPEAAGRVALVRRRAGAVAEVSLPTHSVRSRLHEYGGGSYAVHDGLVLYSDFATQQVWRVRDGEDPRALTPASDAEVRFAAFWIDPGRGVAFCVREDQRDPALEPVTSLVRLDLEGPNDDFGTVVVAGRERPRDVGAELPADVDSPPDFVLDPVLSPGGRRLAWVSWNHPSMPFDGTWLRVGDLDDTGDLTTSVVLAGDPETCVEPASWLDDDRLVFVSHASGWGNLHLADLSGAAPQVRPVHREDVDHGARPWQARERTTAVLPDGRVVTRRTVDGTGSLAVLDPGSGTTTAVPSPVTYVRDIWPVDADHVLASAAFADRGSAVVRIDLRDGTTTPLVPGEEDPDPAWVSIPRSVWWDGTDGERTQGFLYPPTNPDASLADGERPPLVVELHGGPTGMSPPHYAPSTAFWTSRGFAVLDVNYGGSTGFGEAYRRRLDGRWGIVDVQDAVSGVRHLAAEGLADPDRAVIRGGSAGGYSVLAALTSSDVFTAGASYFGISDLVTLVEDTHKLESRYPHRLIAPWPAGRDVYVERSPLTHVDRLAVPLILFQGTDDRVVPPEQARLMAAVLAEKGLPHELVMFEGEGHGFRDPENNSRALETELAFYLRVFGLGDGVTPPGS